MLDPTEVLQARTQAAAVPLGNGEWVTCLVVMLPGQRVPAVAHTWADRFPSSKAAMQAMLHPSRQWAPMHEQAVVDVLFEDIARHHPQLGRLTA